MTSTGLKGNGFASIGTTNPLAAKYPLFEATSAWNLTQAAENQIETGWPAMSDSCQQQTLNTIASSKALTLEVTFQDLSWELLQHMFGEYAQTSATYSSGTGASSRVPSTAPYTYQNDDLIGVPIAEVAIGALSRDNVWGERGAKALVAAAPADASEVQFDNTTGTFTFDEDAAGMPFAWCSRSDKTGLETIGVELNPVAYVELSYQGIICLDGAKAVNGVEIYIPRMKFTENFSFEQSGGEPPAPALTYDLLLAAGNRSVIQFARRAAA